MIKRPGTVLALLVLGFGEVPAATAQESVAPRPVFRGEVALDTPWLALLRAAAAEGSDARIGSVAGEFLADLTKAPDVARALAGSPGLTACCDRQVVQIAFLAGEAADAPLVRLFLHERGLVQGLPGLRGPDRPLVEIFVAEDLSLRLDTIYASTPFESPLADQAGDFVKLVLGRLALPSGADTIVSRVARVLAEPTRSPQGEALRRTQPPLAVTLSRVDLPSKRAKVTISHTISIDNPAARIRAQARWLADTVMREELIAAALSSGTTNGGSLEQGPEPEGSLISACSATAAALAETITAALEEGECAPLGLDPARCFKSVGAAVSAAYETAAGTGDICPGGRAWPLARRFLSIVPSRLTTPSGKVTVTNAPRERWAFGLSTAYITTIDVERARPRARITSGRIVLDPFKRLLAMGVVSFVPAGYDPNGVGLTMAERFRVFGGVAFAPHFGGTAGASWSLNRYLGVNAGYALLAYDTPKPGETIDAPPTEANRAAPFSIASTHAVFVGLTYNIR